MTTPVKEVSTFFVQNEEQNDIIDSLREYSANEKRQVYIIRSPLGNNDFEYDYEKGMMLLIPDFKIIFLTVFTEPMFHEILPKEEVESVFQSFVRF